MYPERRKGICYSAGMHFILLIFLIFDLPSLWSKPLPPEPEAISVELLPITGYTNVKPSESKPAEPDKPKPEPKKDTPPPPAEKTEPPPPDVKKPEPKPDPEKPKPDPKKEEKTKDQELKDLLDKLKKDADKNKPKVDNPTDTKDKNENKSEKYDASQPLSLSEQDAIRSQVSKCWTTLPGAKNARELVVVLRIQLQQDGSVSSATPTSETQAMAMRDAFFRAAMDSAIRAVRMCSPLKNLPPEKYGTWRDLEMSFTPEEGV